MFDEQAPEREGNAIAIVGGCAPGPQRLGHDAEHGAAVEVLAAALEGVTRQPADVKGLGESSRHFPQPT